ncbi:hypothetical protein BDV3_002202 [Batrachochytrium dendrobatidis]
MGISSGQDWSSFLSSISQFNGRSHDSQRHLSDEASASVSLHSSSASVLLHSSSASVLLHSSLLEQSLIPSEPRLPMNSIRRPSHDRQLRSATSAIWPSIKRLSFSIKPTRSFTDLGVVSSRHHPTSRIHSTHTRQFAEKCLQLEYTTLRVLAPSGVYILPVPEAPTLWQGVVFMNEGLFNGGIFRFVIEAGDTYPDTIPVMRFTSLLFHPLVDPLTGVLDSTEVFPSGNSIPMGVVVLIQYMKRILKVDVDDMVLWSLKKLQNSVSNLKQAAPCNMDACKLILNDRNAFMDKAKRSVDASKKYIYEDPDSEIKFSPWDIDVHNRVLHILLTSNSAAEAIDGAFSSKAFDEMHSEMSETT